MENYKIGSLNENVILEYLNEVRHHKISYKLTKYRWNDNVIDWKKNCMTRLDGRLQN